MRITMIMGNTPKVHAEWTKPLRSESAGRDTKVEYLFQSSGQEVGPVTARPAGGRAARTYIVDVASISLEHDAAQLIFIVNGRGRRAAVPVVPQSLP